MEATVENGKAHPRARVVACCGGMVVVFGMERITFEVLRVLREAGAEVHCILNSWENHRIRALAESIGASCSTGRYRTRLERHSRNPIRFLRMFWDIFWTSIGLMRDAGRFDASHVLVPDFVSLLRNAPALLLLRAKGTVVILRTSTAPSRGRFYDFLWRFLIPPLTTTIVAQSEFTLRRCREAGVPERKLVLIKNTLPRRSLLANSDRSIIDLVKERRTLLCIGQIAHFKGTHLAVEAALALLERGCDLQLVVAGRAPKWPPDYVDYYQGLQDRTARTNQRDRFHFVGHIENVPEVMKSCYLLVAPYLGEESFGIVVLEAMSVGLPAVTFALGAIPELVEHRGTGFLCSRFDRDALLEGIDYFWSRPGAWEKARERCLERFRDPESECSDRYFARSWRRLFAIEGESCRETSPSDAETPATG